MFTSRTTSPHDRPRRKRFSIAATTLALSTLFASGLTLGSTTAFATDGILDTSFGVAGKVVTNFTGGTTASRDILTAITAFDDGSFATVGYISTGRFAIAKYKTDGTLDEQFSEDGKTTTSFGTGVNSYAYAAAASGQSLFVTGEISNRDFGVAKYLADGSLDTSFSDDGLATTDFVGGTDNASTIAVTRAGEVFVAGYSIDPDGVFAFGIAKFRANGTLDSGFSGDGLLRVDFLAQQADAKAIALLPDGSLIVGGYTEIAGWGVPAMVKISPDGSLDNSFGTNGKVITQQFNSQNLIISAEIRDLDVSQDGSKIIVSISGEDFVTLRYNSDGIVDTTFGVAGKVTTDFSGGTDDVKSISVLADGTVLVAGQVMVPTIGQDFAVAKYDANGAPDASFGTGGKTTVSMSAGDDYLGGMAVLPSGQIVLGGWNQTAYAAADYAIAKFSGSTPTTTTTTTTTTTLAPIVVETVAPVVVTTTTNAPVVAAVVTTTIPTTTVNTTPPPKEEVVLDLPTPTKPLITDTELVPGAPVTLTFGGFVPGEFVQLIVASTPRVIASGYADSKGFITLSGDIPASLASGDHSLALFAPVSGIGIRQPITVVKAVKTLPQTGSSTRSNVPVSAAVLMVGVLFIAYARRRKSAELTH